MATKVTGMSKISVLAKLVAIEGKREELAEALNVLIDNAGTEPGTLHYTLHADNGDTNVLWMYEIYENSDALAAHSGSSVMKSSVPGMMGLLAGRPELIMCTPLRGTGL